MIPKPVPLAALLLVAAVGGAAASVIPVANPSFETLPAGGLPFTCGGGCSYSVNDPVPGWTGFGSFGQFQPGPAFGNFTYFNTVPNGVTVAYSNDGGLIQTVGVLAQAGVTYTLQVDVGYRKDATDPSLPELVVGSNTITNVIPNPPQFSEDWITDTITYTATALDAGAPISIVLGANAVQGDWDNVRLSDNLAAVPEPVGFLLFGTGIVTLGLLRRRPRSL